MIEKWNKAINNNKVFGAIFAGLSQTFDYICHDLLITKLHACGLLSPLALEMIRDYLLNRKQRTKIGFLYFWCSSRIYFRNPLVNIFLRDLLWEHKGYFSNNYTGDTTPYVVSNDTIEVVENLINITQKSFT